MKTLKIILWVLFWLLMLFIPFKIIKSHPAEIKTLELQAAAEPVIVIPDTVVGMIDYIAPQFGQDPKLISKISYCESQHVIKDHDGGRGKNITGIHDTTFNGWLPLYEKERGETLNIDSTFDQLKMMSWAFSKGESYRRQWTTYVAYLNGGEYTFYSKLLKGTYTAKCK